MPLSPAELRPAPEIARAVGMSNPDWLFPMLAPGIETAVKQTKLPYVLVDADVAAQTNRTLATAPTVSTLGENFFTIDNAEKVQDIKADSSSIDALGGLDRAQMKAGRIAFRAVNDVVELATATNYLAGAAVPTQALGNSIVETVDLVKNTIIDRTMGGRVVIVCSSRVFTRLKGMFEIRARMKNTGVVTSDIRDVRGISRMQVAAILGVDDIMIGPDRVWYAGSGTFQDRLSVAIMPDGRMDPDEEPQFTRTSYTPAVWRTPLMNAAQIFTFGYAKENAEYVRAQLFCQSHLLNPSLATIITGVTAGALACDPCDEEPSV